jgi:hypothetical protein
VRISLAVAGTAGALDLLCLIRSVLELILLTVFVALSLGTFVNSSLAGIAVLIGATLSGVIGALLAIPVAAAIQIVVRDVWQQHQDGSSEAPAQPWPERHRRQQIESPLLAVWRHAARAGRTASRLVGPARPLRR